MLASARTLFSERGFEQTTVRDIGDHSGVDPALIARYFGSKVKLYLATVTAEDAESGRPEGLQRSRGPTSQWLVARVDARGPGPVLQAILRSDTTAGDPRGGAASISPAASSSRSHAMLERQRASPIRGCVPRWP